MSLSLREVEGIEIASKLLRSPLGRSKGCHKATDRLQEVLAGPFGGLTQVFCDYLVSCSSGIVLLLLFLLRALLLALDASTRPS